MISSKVKEIGCGKKIKGRNSTIVCQYAPEIMRDKEALLTNDNFKALCGKRPGITRGCYKYEQYLLLIALERSYGSGGQVVRIPAGSKHFLPACRSRAILPTLVGLCFFYAASNLILHIATIRYANLVLRLACLDNVYKIFNICRRQLLNGHYLRALFFLAIQLF